MTRRLTGPRAVRPVVVLLAVALATILSPGSGSAQFLSSILSRADTVAGGSAANAPEFGTSSESVLVIGAEQFQLVLGTEFLPNGNNTGRTCQVGDGPSQVCAYIATVNLPSGALIESLDLEGCDGDAVAQFGFALAQFSVPVQNGSFVSPVFASGATPGCAVFPVAMTTPRTVDNTAEKLVFAVNVQPGTNVGFTTTRVHYKLQVSPAPGTATFGDVPTNHPFFQFVEALAASGITGGCGSGNYCPNSPVTRGQMAVFLSKALGLHFPN